MATWHLMVSVNQEVSMQPSPAQVCQVDTYFTDMHWHPLGSKGGAAGTGGGPGGTDIAAVGCTNGVCLT